ncbi:MAG: IS110 family transposase [Candidatus Bipolaricaulia bacterium]
MRYVGIDWADEDHKVCILDEEGEVISATSIPHSREGFLKLLALLRGLSTPTPDLDTDPQEILIALETDKGLLVDFLLIHGYPVYGLNPKVVDRYRERYSVAKRKSDQFDAFVLANILRTDRHRFRPILPDSELIRELRLLTRDHKKLVKERTRLANQLIGCLKEYYPAAVHLFCKVDQPLTLEFLKRYPTDEKARRMPKEELIKLLAKYRNSKEDAEKKYRLLHEPQIEVGPEVVRAKSRYMLSLVRRLEVVLEEIDHYEEEIKRLLVEHPDSELFLSLPGAGEILAARMLAEIGDNPYRYRALQELRCLAGTAPVTLASGRFYHRVRFRRACNKELRDALQLQAFLSLSRCPWAREYYDRKRGQGKAHQESLRMLADRWVRIIFAMRRDRRCYDEEHHLRMREEHAARGLAVPSSS